MSENDFYVGAGFQLRDSDAAVVAGVVSQLAKVLKRPVRPEDLLDHARDVASPLHGLFEWDDAAAAHAWRIARAGYLIRSVRVRQETIETRALLNVTTSNGAGYLPAETVFATPDLATQVVDRAKAELRLWAKRHELLRDRAELRKVFSAIAEEVSPGTETHKKETQHHEEVEPIAAE